MRPPVRAPFADDEENRRPRDRARGLLGPAQDAAQRVSAGARNRAGARGGRVRAGGDRSGRAPRRSMRPISSASHAALDSRNRAMPELPEVESLRRILARSAADGRSSRPASWSRGCGGRSARGLCGGDRGPHDRSARAAREVSDFELAGGDALMVHLGMSGSLTHRPAIGAAAGGPASFGDQDDRSTRATTTSSSASMTAAAWSTTIRAASD